MDWTRRPYVSGLLLPSDSTIVEERGAQNPYLTAASGSWNVFPGDIIMTPLSSATACNAWLICSQNWSRFKDHFWHVTLLEHFHPLKAVLLKPMIHGPDMSIFTSPHSPQLNQVAAFCTTKDSGLMAHIVSCTQKSGTTRILFKLGPPVW